MFHKGFSKVASPCVFLHIIMKSLSSHLHRVDDKSTQFSGFTKLARFNGSHDHVTHVRGLVVTAGCRRV